MVLPVALFSINQSACFHFEGLFSAGWGAWRGTHSASSASHPQSCIVSALEHPCPST